MNSLSSMNQLKIHVAGNIYGMDSWMHYAMNTYLKIIYYGTIAFFLTWSIYLKIFDKKNQIHYFENLMI